MNYLAHLLLSGGVEETIMGNFVGDFIKGRFDKDKVEGWNASYLLGLKLHRFIDSYTDSHPLVKEAKRFAARKFGKTSGIVMDIYFDYYLALDFRKYSAESLSDFCARMYQIFERQAIYIPSQMKPMVEAMVAQNWLEGYETVDGIDKTFTRMSRRLPYLFVIRDAAQEMVDNHVFYQERFSQFYPELKEQSDNFVKINSGK